MALLQKVSLHLVPQTDQNSRGWRTWRPGEPLGHEFEDGWLPAFQQYAVCILAQDRSRKISSLATLGMLLRTHARAFLAVSIRRNNGSRARGPDSRNGRSAPHPDPEPRRWPKACHRLSCCC